MKVFRRALYLLLAAMLGAGVHAQTLARRGWAGSGISVEHWWQSAIFYQIDPQTLQDTQGDLNGISAHFDSLQELGVDAVVLSPFPLPKAPSNPLAEGTQPSDPAFGTEDAFTLMLQEASRHKIRVLVDLNFDNTLTVEQTVNTARFWLSRGIAGLRLTDANPHGASLTPPQITARLAELTRLCAGYPGQRVLFWALAEPAGTGLVEAGPKSRRSHPTRSRSAARHMDGKLVSGFPNGPQLILDDRLLHLNHWLPTDLRRLLATTDHPRFPLATSVTESDANEWPSSLDRLGESVHSPATAKQIAALLLLGRETPQLYAGQELSKPAAQTANVAPEDAQSDSLQNWYRRLSTLRHTHLALRSGSLDLLPARDPEIVAWIRRPSPGAAAEPPVLVLCNFSPRATVVSLAAELHALGVPTGRGLLRSLASSATADLGAPVPVSGIALPAYGVYVGELQLQPGLESMPAPARPRSGRSSATSSTRGR